MLPFLEIISDVNVRNRVEELYYMYRDLIFKIAKGQLHDDDLAEDAVHDTFLELAQKCEEMDLSSDEGLKKWLSKAVVGNASKIFNKGVSQEKLIVDISELFRFEDKSSEREFFSQFTAIELQKAIDQLEDKYRIPFYQHIIYGMHYKEIAKSFGISELLARQRVYLANQKLKEMLEKEEKINE